MRVFTGIKDNIKNKRIAFVLGSMSRGGAERVISILSDEFIQRGWNVDICMLLSSDVGYSLDTRIRLYSFNGNTDSRVARIPYWLCTIRNFVKKNNPDVIVSFAARINILVQIACLGLNKKIIVSERNDPRYDGRGLLANWMTKILYPYADGIVFQTERAKDFFSKQIQKNSLIIPNPINVSIPAQNTDINKIVAVGRLVEQKNFQILIEAFNDVIFIYPQKKLYIYGEGHLRKKLEKSIVDLGLVDKVFLCGNVLDVHNQIKDAAMFVMSSDYEGLSNALLEAMVMGLPCISTKCAGADEYIDNGGNGLLVPIKDKKALTEAMLTFIENENLRCSCGKAAIKIIDRVGVNVVMKQWLDIVGG